jgi:hypothetical protein
MNKTAETGKLSRPMMDALREIHQGEISTARTQTLKALEARGYVTLTVDGFPSLTEAGKANAVMYFGEIQPSPTSDAFVATTFDVTQADNHIADYFEEETTASTSETAVEAVPGLEAYLDTPHVVPNRSDRRGWRKVRAVFNRTRAKVQDRRTAESVRKENSRKVRKGLRKASV